MTLFQSLVAQIKAGMTDDYLRGKYHWIPASHLKQLLQEARKEALPG